MQRLLDNLTAAGKSPVPLRFADGTRLLVLPDGGRVLGLYPPGSEENFLWTSPALAAPETAVAWARRDGWPNPGGDRTWLAPEIELFIGDLTRASATYRVPPALDPGNWRVVDETGEGLCLTLAARLLLNRSRVQVNVRLHKRVGLTANPLPCARGLQYAGYMLETAVEADPEAESRLGVWNLLQLPQPGEMLVATVGEARPRLVFGHVPNDDLAMRPGLLRWAMRGAGPDTKVALKATTVSGRAGHLHCRADGTADLVVRAFDVHPEDDYVDALWEAPHETGWAFQACAVHDGADRFNELEYHAPAGRHQESDVSHVWAYRGPRDVVAGAAAALLGADIERVMGGNEA